MMRRRPSHGKDWMWVRAGIAACCVFAVLGCAPRRAFTPQDSAVHASSAFDIQYFLSRNTRISRVRESGAIAVSSEHLIRSVAREHVEEIHIGADMPGALVGVAGDTLLVSFEPPVAGGDRYLRFVPSKSSRYELATTPVKSDPPYELVFYNGDDYRLGKYGKKWSSFSKTFTFYPQQRPHLVVRVENIVELEKRIRSLPGRAPGE